MTGLESKRTAAVSTEQQTLLDQTLATTQAVTDDIHSASNQAFVIGSVLATELPEEVKVDEVAQAIEQTEQLEHKLAASADKLSDVSAALKEEIEVRKDVAAELEQTRALVDRLSAKLEAEGKTPPV